MGPRSAARVTRGTAIAGVAAALTVLLAACVPPGFPRPDAPGHGPPAIPDAVCTRWLEGDRTSEPTDGGSRLLADRCLRVNHLQVVGSHNSYHIRPEEPLFSALAAFDPALAIGFDYTHAPLAEQFSDQHVRQIELDVFADPDGGRYANRNAMPLLGLPAASGIPALDEPGFKVLHVQEVDFLSRCWTFVECLQQVKAWSDAHPDHVPIAILVELKDSPIPDPFDVFVQPLPIGPAELDALDAEIRSVFADDEVITPDDVRGSAPTLEAAVLDGAWPRLGEARGKVLFLMDNGGRFRTDYLAGHPSLAGRVLFTNASPGDPDAAFVKRNDPTGANTAAIADLVRRGYVVRTRADADTLQARTGDTTRRDAALASGAQWVSTDYPAPGMSDRFGTDYVARIPGGHVARCNPVNTGRLCRDGALEP